MASSPGDGPDPRRAATYKDIRAATGLSLATISRYFNGGVVRSENRAAIEEAAARLRFRVNPFARGLRTRRSRTVGVLLPALTNSFHLGVISGVEAELARHGVGVVVATAAGESGAGEAVAFLVDRLVDGIIAAPAPGTGEDLLAAAGGLPLVLVDRLIEGVDLDAVVLDNRLAGRLAVGLVLAASHRRISIIAGEHELWSLAERADGAREAVVEAGGSSDAFEVLHVPATVESGRAAVGHLLATGRATAVVCLNRELTVGGMIAVNEAGTAVPDDVSFVGFDSSELARVVRPRLSVVVQPTRDIAAQAARLMLDRLDDPTERPGRLVTLAPIVEEGLSVRPPRGRTGPSVGPDDSTPDRRPTCSEPS